MSASLKQRSLHTIHSAIARFWVEPLELRVIPRLEKKPGRLSKYLLRRACWLSDAGSVLVNELRPRIIRWVGKDWSVTYLGNAEATEFLCHELFPTPLEEVESRRVSLWQVPALARKRAGEGDLVVCEFNQIIHFSPDEFNLAFTTPRFINQVIGEFDRPLEEIKASFYKDIRRRIQQLEAQGYSYEATHSEADFHHFYYHMYLPYITGRHAGRSPMICEYDLMFSYFKDGVLILVKLDGEPVAGGVLKMAGDLCMALQMGVLDGQFERVKQGSNVALWWSGMNWAHQQGAREFEIGIGFPLTSNGPFNFKRHWGTRVVRDTYNHVSWNFLGKNVSSRLREHLTGLGFITERDGKYYQVLLQDPPELPDGGTLANQLYHLSKCGIAGVMVSSSTGEKQLIPYEAVKQDHTGKRYLALPNLAAQ